MPNRQLDLALDSSSAPPAGVVEGIRDEIARAWGLPLGERVEITFRPAFPLPATVDRLELLTTPDFPWDSHQPLRLRVAGSDFGSRDIERGKIL